MTGDCLGPPILLEVKWIVSHIPGCKMANITLVNVYVDLVVFTRFAGTS